MGLFEKEKDMKGDFLKIDEKLSEKVNFGKKKKKEMIEKKEEKDEIIMLRKKKMKKKFEKK